MLALYGTGVSSGIFIGRAYVLYRKRPEIPQYLLTATLVDEEIARFERALQDTRDQLQAIRDHIPAAAPPETASFIDTHLLILEDSMVTSAPIDMIRGERCNAEWALKRQCDHLTAMFDQLDDAYIRNRKTDVIQVVERIQRNLLREVEIEDEGIAAGQIVVANDLTPADTVMLKHKHIRAFVTDLGGPISHTAILARSLGIPAIVSVHNVTGFIRSNDMLIVDGKRGAIVVGADKLITAEYRRRQRDITRHRKELDRLRRHRSVTLDRQKILLEANIELPPDVKAAIKASASGIGLYRTEFLFMNRETPPSEEEQFRAYVKVVKTMGKKPVTIRTLDLGADKSVDGGKPDGHVTVNPALGLRAVRLCLQDANLFKPQLRAILRASAHGKIRIMIPMLSSLDELFQVLALIDELKGELRKEGHQLARNIPVGGMIEVPAAAIAADLFAPHLDFLSIGTNDLIQYTLAIDRVDDEVNYLYDPLHPSVLRLIAMTIDAGKAAGIPVSMCGEMAGDPRYTRLLLGLGLTELSMHPATLLAVKRVVCSSRISTLRRFARAIMRIRDVHELHAAVDAGNERYDRVGRSVPQ